MNKLIDTFANRLNYAMLLKDIKAIELAEKTGIDKSKISSYLSGRYKAKQDGVFLLAQVLNVSGVWLMGYDVPMQKEFENIEPVKLVRDNIIIVPIFRSNTCWNTNGSC